MTTTGPRTNTPQQSIQNMLLLVDELSRLLAVELDYHYEDKDAKFIGSGVECLIAASTLLKANGLAPSDACSHSIRRFYRKTTDRLC
ncbi:hypothetical protein [Vannielia litorea]|uniref:hypothetical protein n=1 Tax=Vannielia litorea TaxID=1217970 RepID=UPI001C95F9AF|nr:hypothetical protein [Vannielia litorea]MBY6046706.1 hypothetical protein [Vannielia litorea]MBY6074120.1 hypothetical protein [Vannielia litorea]